MHRALQIPELVQLICSEVEHPTFPGPSVHQDLYSLAQVSRSFSSPALDLLWARQNTLANILSCMPTDLWEVTVLGSQRSFRARRAIEPEDWTRFHEYAPRIKFFSTSGFGYEVGAQDTWLPVFEVLSAAIETPHIFPNLQTLWWLVAGPWFPYARLFLCPRMKSLVLGHLKTPAHFALLPTLPRWCPLLTSVTLRTAQQLYMNCRPCSLMVCRMAFLEKLDVDNIDQNAFEHISQLETLKSLAVKRAPDFTPSRPAADVHRFPNLRELTLSKVSLEFLTAFIEMNEFWSFERLDAYMTSTPIAAETARLYALIGTKCDPTTLTTLTLRASSTRGSLSVDLLARGIVTFDAICPLLRMKSLQQVSLAPPGGFSLDDSGIEAVARAWPDILTLDLPGSEYRGPPPRVTLSGIRAFARHCPRLVVLSTPFDASVVPDEDVVLPHEALRLLIVEDAVLVDPAVVAEYLGAMFPKLEAIGTAIRREVVEDVRERADRLHALWKEVGLAPARVTATAVKITA